LLTSRILSLNPRLPRRGPALFLLRFYDLFLFLLLHLASLFSYFLVAPHLRLAIFRRRRSSPLLLNSPRGRPQPPASSAAAMGQTLSEPVVEKVCKETSRSFGIPKCIVPRTCPIVVTVFPRLAADTRLGLHVLLSCTQQLAMDTGESQMFKHCMDDLVSA
jgi:hypothetical protein